MKLLKREWIFFLDTYSEAVRQKKYKKIDYGLWCILKRDFPGNQVDLSLEKNNAIKILTDIWEYYVYIGDGAFGDFLYEKLFKENKENDIMKGFNFDFGPCSNDNIRMSIYGLAIKNNAGIWVSYNNGQIVDVDVFNFDGRQYMFKMPVAIKDIAVGDIVIHNRVPMFVTSIENGSISAVDVHAGEAKTIIPTTNMFGFNFITKIVSMFDAFTGAPTADQPFGNMLPFIMAGNSDIDPMMMFFMMNQNNSNFNMNNPMMLYLMMSKSGESNDWMLPMLMMNMNNN